MGMLVFVSRSSLGDSTNNGASKYVDGFCLTNVPGPFQPSDECPAAVVVDTQPFGRPYPHIVPADLLQASPMMGGNYAGTSDSRFCEFVREAGGGPFGMLPIFDRVEN